MVRFVVFMLVLAAAVAYAFNRGGRPERVVATTILSVQLLDLALHAVLDTDGQITSMDFWHIPLDLIILSVTGYMALTADRFWPLVAAALQLVTTAGHAAAALNLSMTPLIYAILIETLSYLLIFTIAVGTYLHDRRTKDIPRG